MMLAVREDVVRLHVAAPGNTTSLNELMPQLQSAGVKAVSPNGVLGDPREATAGEGYALLDAHSDQLIDDVAKWRT